MHTVQPNYDAILLHSLYIFLNLESVDELLVFFELEEGKHNQVDNQRYAWKGIFAGGLSKADLVEYF